MTKFLFNGKEFETRREAEEYIYDEYTEAYDDYLDEQGEVDVCGLKYYPSRVLKKVDPIAYRCIYNDFCDLFYDEIEEIEEDEEDEDEEESPGRRKRGNGVEMGG